MKFKIAAVARAWWDKASPRDKKAAKVLGVVLAAALVFQVGVRMLVLGTIQKRRQLHTISAEANAQAMMLGTIPFEIQKFAKELQDINLTQRNIDNPTPLLIYHLGECEDRFGYAIQTISMPNAPESDVLAAARAPMTAPSHMPPDVPGAPPAAPQAPAASKFNMVVVEVSMLATYEQVGRLLDSLNDLPIVVKVQNFVMTKSKTGPANEVNIIFKVAKRRQT